MGSRKPKLVGDITQEAADALADMRETFQMRSPADALVETPEATIPEFDADTIEDI